MRKTAKKANSRFWYFLMNLYMLDEGSRRAGRLLHLRDDNTGEL
jgi:hypothetical protein